MKPGQTFPVVVSLGFGMGVWFSPRDTQGSRFCAGSSTRVEFSFKQVLLTFILPSPPSKAGRGTNFEFSVFVASCLSMVPGRISGVAWVCGGESETYSRGGGYRRDTSAAPPQYHSGRVWSVRAATNDLNSNQGIAASASVIPLSPGWSNVHRVFANSSERSLTLACPVLWVQYLGLHFPST